MDSLKIMIAPVDEESYTIAVVWRETADQETGFHMKLKYGIVSYEEGTARALKAYEEFKKGGAVSGDFHYTSPYGIDPVDNKE